jgi:hypothetical protein
MFAQGSVYLPLKGTLASSLADNSTLPAIIVSPVVLIALANCGMLAVANASRHSAGIMMKCLMHVSTVQETSSQLHQQMESLVYITYSLGRAYRSYKGMKMRFLRSLLTLRATKLLRLVAIRLADCGQWTLEMKCKFYPGTRMKSSHALSTMRETLSLQGQRITHAVSGKTSMR